MPAQHVFDADALAESMSPPAVRLGGRTLVGEVLSREQFMQFEKRMARLAAGEMEGPELGDFFRDYLRAVFPRRWRFWRALPALDPVHRILVHPAVIHIMKDFFVCQAQSTRALSLVSPTTPGQTS